MTTTATPRLIKVPSYMLFCYATFIVLLYLINNFDIEQKSLNFRTGDLEDAVRISLYNRTEFYSHKQTSKATSKNLKYILALVDVFPFIVPKEGQEMFVFNKCNYSNCYLTFNSKLLNNISDFDAIVFSGGSLRYLKTSPFEKRSVKQKYVFATLEPPSKWPVLQPFFDEFFNWTWTYRLESNVPWRHITIYDLKGNIVGPSVDMKWPNNLKPIGEQFKRKLKHKTKAVAWFITNCSNQMKKEYFFEKFKVEFEKYGHSVDVYGKCEQVTTNITFCDRTVWCLKMLEKYYHFYFSFETTLDEDFVTNILMSALDNFVVPVVYGGANYSRFLPPGSYLNAKELGPKKLAKAIDDALRNSTKYYDFFRWRNHFKYESSATTSELCNICAALNDNKMMKTNVVTNFRRWWNTPTRQKTYEYMLGIFSSNKNLQSLANAFDGTRENKQYLWKYITNLSSNPRDILNIS